MTTGSFDFRSFARSLPLRCPVRMNIAMNRTSALPVQSQRQSSRRIRRWLAIGLSITTAVSGWAQNAVSTMAGGNPGYVNATGASAQFRFTIPSGAAVDTSGNVYVADAVNNVIRKIDPNGVVTTFAGAAPVGGAAATAGNADGTGTAASFSGPQGIAIDGFGNLYVADTGNHAIRMITPAGVVTTLAGTSGLTPTVTGPVSQAIWTARAQQRASTARSGWRRIRPAAVEPPSMSMWPTRRTRRCDRSSLPPKL